MQPGLLQPSLPLLTTLRRPGLPGMHPHCSNFAQLLAFCLSRFTHTCSLLTCLCSLVSTVLSFSNWSLPFAAILLAIVLNTPTLFVTSGKPLGLAQACPNYTFCMCTFVVCVRWVYGMLVWGAHERGMRGAFPLTRP